MFNFRTGFSLIEIIVVATILGLMATFTAIYLSTSSKASRDAKRRSDLEEIRLAEEQYYNIHNVYLRSDGVNPPYTSLPYTCGLTQAMAIGTEVYLKSVPQDPSCPNITYQILSINDQSYMLGAYLENGGTPCGGHCGPGSTDNHISTGAPCNYCVGPYGKN